MQPGLVLLLLLTVGLSPSADSFQMQSTFSGFCATARDARLLCSPSLGSVALGSSVTNMGLRSSIRTTALCPDGDTVLRAGAADFVLESFDPEEEEDELSNENLLKILYSQTTDYYVNDVVWKALGEEIYVHTYSCISTFMSTCTHELCCMRSNTRERERRTEDSSCIYLLICRL